jgi:hypothetical protein
LYCCIVQKKPGISEDIPHPSSGSASKPSKEPTRSRNPLFADFLLDPEDEGDTIFQNAGLFSELQCIMTTKNVHFD